MAATDIAATAGRSMGRTTPAELTQPSARAARGLALLRSQASASVEEVRAVALPVLRHRVIANYNATGEGITVDQIVAKLIGKGS